MDLIVVVAGKVRMENRLVVRIVILLRALVSGSRSVLLSVLALIVCCVVVFVSLLRIPLVAALL
jgi:hypothetical protein